MTTQCKSLLKKIREFTNYNDTQFGYVGGLDAFCLDGNTDILLYYTEFVDEIGSIMDTLIAEGYVRYGFNNYHFSLTQKGIHKEQYSSHAFHVYLRDNWIAIVALIISFIALIRSL